MPFHGLTAPCDSVWESSCEDGMQGPVLHSLTTDVNHCGMDETLPCGICVFVCAHHMSVCWVVVEGGLREIEWSCVDVCVCTCLCGGGGC